MARKCCVNNCGVDGQDVRNTGLPLHKFPKDYSLRGKWLENVGYGSNCRSMPVLFICHRHFRKADYESTTHRFILKKGSVPTIFRDYDNHPDPLSAPVKPKTTYPQEDLDLINAKIMNRDHGESSPRCPRDSLKANGFANASNSATDENLVEDLKEEANKVEKRVENEESVTGKMKFTENPPAEPPPQPQGVIPLPQDPVATTAARKMPLETVKPLENSTNNLPKPVKNLKTKVDKSRLINRTGIKFFPGAKLEAKDFNEKWYAARVVETDWAEREVFIHFEKWSSRFDEWIPMDSSRLRILQMQPNEQTWEQPTQETRMREFTVGERILATWADGRKYPAKVSAVLGNDKYDVLFDDGYGKIVRSSKMTKIASTTTKIEEEVDTYIGSKQERRDRKRKHTVMELFQHKRRSKTDGDKVVKKDDSNLSPQLENGDGKRNELLDDLGPEVAHNLADAKGKMKNYSRKKVIKLEPKLEPISEPKPDYTDDLGPEWINGEPQGIEAFVVDGNDGSRRSIIVPDKKLPTGWQKHFIQRRTGSSAGKWDVLFLHKATGKKFRSRNDIRVFHEAQREPFDADMFDFCIHRRKRTLANKIKAETTPGEAPKKIKILLPKSKTPAAGSDNGLLTSTPGCSLMPVVTPSAPVDTAVYIGGLRVEMEDSAYKCPKDGCNKTFRKENLLQMHIKHYHPEFSKYLGSTPNVADLAYARTIGESMIDSTPKKPPLSFAERFGKVDKRKLTQEKSQTPVFAHPPSPAVASPDVSGNEYINGLREEAKFDLMLPGSTASMDMDYEMGKKADGNCAMSPSTLFDLKLREERTQSGIKTLLPVRPSVDFTKDRSKSTDDSHPEKPTRGQRKRQLSEYSSDASTRSKRYHPGMQELTDEYGDLDDSALDAEGPSALVYRFSRRKSDLKSDENSQSSQLYDSRERNILNENAAKSDINNESQDGEGVMMMINGELVKVEQLRREEIINCTCGFMEEDGLMIQCDLCLCWQHGHCNAIEREKDVPEKYICYICRHPYRQRQSQKYIHDQDWLKEGKLQSLSRRTKDQSVINQRTAMLKRSYDLVGALLQIQQMLHSLRVKINVAQKKDHPKLYLWANNWDKSEIPKPIVEPVSVMEIIKTEPELTEITAKDTSQREIETAKEELENKSIDSDTELMKILEEDNSTTEEKLAKDVANDPNIFMDALRKCEDKKKFLNTEDHATKSVNDTPSTLEPADHQDWQEKCLKMEEIKPKVPLQPFIPEPEAPIDPTECRLRLLEHIAHFQNHIDSQLTSIEAQVCVLEAMDPEDVAANPEVQPRTKQTMQMLLRDLATVRKLASLC